MDVKGIRSALAFRQVREAAPCPLKSKNPPEILIIAPLMQIRLPLRVFRSVSPGLARPEYHNFI